MTAATTEIESPLSRLSPEQIDALGSEFDAIRDRVRADLGERDRRYIESMIEMHRRLGVISRALLLASNNPPARWAGTAALSAAKILENMEIGHNVLHGQWDWMNDPRINSSTWDWDNASTAEAWKHSHNYVHHTFTNIRGKDKDLGYEIMRIDPEQPWHPVYLLQPFYNLLLAAFFEWGVAVHDLDFEAIRTGEKSKRQVKRELRGIRRKGEEPDRQGLHRLAAAERAGDGGGRAGPGGARRPPRAARGAGGGAAGNLRRALGKGAKAYRSTAKANATANAVRNVWSYAIIFCGHFPDQTYTFSEAEVEDESQGGWYVRQLLGAANIEGSPFFHVASGNLGYQVEHHLFPDLPSTRYAEWRRRSKTSASAMACPTTAAPSPSSWGWCSGRSCASRLPGGEHRPKPGPYRAERAHRCVT